MWMMLPFVLNSLLSFVVGLLVAKFLGPEEYGRYVVALSLGIVLQTLLLDWLRLSATRFYSERDRRDNPQVRATLDLAFGLLAALALTAAFVIWTWKLELALSPELAVLAIGVALSNAAFDTSGALLRARFLDKAYGVFIVAKNVLSFAFSVGGAMIFHSAPVALVGIMLSVAGSLVAARGELIDPGATPARAQGALALRFFAYGAPIVIANFLHQTVPFANRLMVSHTLGYAEAGQLSLAFEIGVRIVAAIGSALDVILFQIAVLAEKTHGADSARSQVSRNMGAVFAVVLPSVVGCWLILPSFEALFVPQNFRGPFAHYFTLTAPALLAYALMNYAVNPAFQIAHRLSPLVIAALVACLANSLAVMLLPDGADASKYAVAQSVSTCAGLAALIAMLFWLEPMWPRPRDILGALGACALMLAAGLQLRGMTPGVLALAAQVFVGALAYGAGAYVFDVAELRSALAPRIFARLKARRAARA